MALLKASLFIMLAIAITVAGFFIGAFLTPILFIVGVALLLYFIQWESKQNKNQDRLP